MEFKIREEDTPPCGRVDVGHMSGREKSRSASKTGSLGLSESESLTRGLACQTHIPSFDAALHDIPRELPHKCQWASESGMRTQQSSCSPVSQ